MVETCKCTAGDQMMDISGNEISSNDVYVPVPSDTIMKQPITVREAR